jgi:uncharacterized surface protein with fasciclin (FAS1) repeats
MKKSILSVAVVLTCSLYVTSAFSQKQDTTRKTTVTTTTTTTVKPDSLGNVARTLLSNPDYSTIAAAAKTANLEASVSGSGPYTIFAPSNAAFAKLSAGRQDSLLKDTAKLSALLKTHVVAGKYGKAEIIKTLTAGKGKATLTTIDGQTLKLSISPKSTLQLTDANGNVAEVILYDLQATNGVVNGINNILMPANKQTM